MFTLALITALGVYFIFMRIGMRRVLGFGAAADITTSIGLVLLGAATFSGMMVALIAGAMLSVMLFTTRLFLKPTKMKLFRR